MTAIAMDRPIDLPVVIDSPDAAIEGDWSVPLHPKGTMLIVNCTDSGRFSRRNRRLAHHLYDDGFAILILDLLTHAEEVENNLTGAVQIDVALFADRITSAAGWVQTQHDAGQLPVMRANSKTLRTTRHKRPVLSSVPCSVSAHCAVPYHDILWDASPRASPHASARGHAV